MTIDDDARAALAPFARDAAAGLDAQAAGVRPDLAAMLARARALAAEPPAPTLVLVPREPPATPARALVAHDEPPDERDADLAPFTTALRDELDAKLHARARTGAPPLPAAARIGRTRGVLLGLLAAAAAALLLLAGPRLAGRTADRAHAALASAAAPADPTSGTARSVPSPVSSDSRSTPVPSDIPAAHVPSDSPSVPAPSDIPAAPAPEPVVADPDSPTLAPTTPVPSDSHTRPRSRRPAAPLALTLEQEAQALWERGELAAAERKLREVLRLPDARRAELAYGDLFALTRQMYGADRQVDVWRAYLGRFPRGRFAEDARAGLCQRAAPDDQPACWRAYLEHHPHGAHRERARAGAAP
jgi:hypothetical protein